MIKLNIQRFGHTNSTPNYELPQFVGTDKPQWLTDINQAFLAIDTAIHTAYGSASQANTNIGDLTNLTTTAKNNLVSSINEIDSDLGGVSSTVASHTIAIGDNTTAIGTLANLTTTSKSNLVSAVNEVDLVSSNNATSIGTLSSLTTTEKSNLVGAINEVNAQTELNTDNISKFNLTSFTSYSGSQMSGTGVQSYSNITVATNSDGSIGKVYGSIFIQTSSESAMTVTLPNTALRPTSNITINNCGLTIYGGSGLIGESMEIQTNGTIVFTLYNVAGATQRHTIIPCLYFMKDFGDTPTP